jgi:hypothetical protein
MLDLDVPMLLSKLARRGYITARVKPTLEGATISFIEPPNVIAGKGTVRVDYNFERRTLGIESPNPEEILAVSDEVWNCLREINVDIQKALIPYEVIIIAVASLKPKFTDTKYAFKDLLGCDLRLIEGGFIKEGEDPTSNKWFHLRISPIWGSYNMDEKENLYRVTVIYREERSELIKFIENVESILRKLLKEV